MEKWAVDLVIGGHSYMIIKGQERKVDDNEQRKWAWGKMRNSMWELWKQMKNRNGQALRVEASLGKALTGMGTSEHICPYGRGKGHWREINWSEEEEPRTGGAKGSRGRRGWKWESGVAWQTLERESQITGVPTLTYIPVLSTFPSVASRAGQPLPVAQRLWVWYPAW